MTDLALLLDEGLPVGAALALRAEGWDIVHVLERGLGGAEDAVILDAAVREKRTLASLDADMGRLLHLTGASAPSVLHLRVHGLDRDATIRLLRAVVSSSSPICERARSCPSSPRRFASDGSR